MMRVDEGRKKKRKREKVINKKRHPSIWTSIFLHLEKNGKQKHRVSTTVVAVEFRPM